MMNLVRNRLSKTYSGKRVLVTGHTGFKGSWIAIWLKELGADVIGYALEAPTKPNNFDACQLSQHLVHIKGDVRDSNSLLEIFNKFQPEIVFHLAAQPLVRHSYLHPKLTFDTNIGGTVNMLEAVRATDSVRIFVNVTSDKCYENREWVWGYRENDPMGGHDPYSASKGCCELVFSAYMKSFFSGVDSGHRKLGMASVRAGNVIGGGDWAKDRLIPDCVRALVDDHPIVIRNPNSIRPWQHVLEPLGGYLWVGALLNDNPEKFSGAWNFGPTESGYLTVKEVVSRFIDFWGSGDWSDVPGAQPLHEAGILKLSCDKARSLLGWKSILKIDECLEFTSEWYKTYYAVKSNRDLYRKCREQIEQYMDKAAQRGFK